MTVKRPAVLANFEARSVALIAGWTIAGAAMAQNMPSPRPEENKSGTSLFLRADGHGDGQVGQDGAIAMPSLVEEEQKKQDKG